MYILHSKQPSDNNLSSQARLQTHRMGMAPFQQHICHDEHTDIIFFSLDVSLSLRRHSPEVGQSQTDSPVYPRILPSTSGSALKQAWLKATDSSSFQPTHARVMLYCRWAQHYCILSESNRHMLI